MNLLEYGQWLSLDLIVFYMSWLGDQAKREDLQMIDAGGCSYMVHQTESKEDLFDSF